MGHQRRIDPGPTKRGGARAVAAATAVLGLSGGAAAQDLELHPLRARWRAQIENLDPDGSDNLVVGGLHYDLLNPFQTLPGLYIGMGGFGALTGDRGGFIVAGGTVGWRRRLSDDWTLDVGQFIGGGGGGSSAPPGGQAGGMYLRPHLALERRYGGASLRFEASHVNTPGGDIESTQIAFGIQGFDELLTAAYSIQDLDQLPATAFEAGNMPLTTTLHAIFPSSRSERRDNTPLDDRILLTSLAVERGLGDGWYAPFELSGAIGGGVPGYAQFLLGMGYREPLLENSMDWRAQFSMGGGGGGGVDTGGGLLADARVGLDAILSRDWRLHLLAGYMGAIDGKLDGATLTAGVSWSPVPIELRNGFDRARLNEEGVWADEMRLDPWTFQVIHKSYELDSTVTLVDKVPLSDRKVHLVGVGTEKQVSDDFDISIRAFTAYAGDLAGYHEGQLGLRYTIPIAQPVDAGDFYVQYHAGAAGGGDVRVGSGLVHNLTAGWRWRPTRNLRIGLEAGRVESESGEFEGDTYALTLSWGVTRPLQPL